LNPEPGFPLCTSTFSPLVMRSLSSVRVRYRFAFLLCNAIPHAGAAQTLTTLQSFNSRDGSKSFAASPRHEWKVRRDNVLWRLEELGEVFEVTLGGKLATLYSLCSKSACTDGAYTYAIPVQGTDGNFYGTTYSGGANGDGTVFKISLTGTLTTLHSFGGTDESEPLAGLVQGTNGDLHGTTYMGGSKGDGVVFKITLGVHAA
jgi:uncharacterized repeat protein (TIGR03803 family)